MTDWRERTLGDIADSGGGFVRTGPFGSQLHQHDYVDGGPVAVVMPKDMAGGRIRFDSIARVSTDTAQRLAEHLLSEGDIVLARRGDVGRAAWVDARDGTVLCGTGSMRIHIPQGDLRSRFLHYYLQTMEAVAWLQSRAVGATMPNLNGDIVRALPVVYPDRRAQDTIISVLDSLEYLVENNRRRIELLGEMAQAIYREWFVYLRYPGHEADELVDSSLGRIPMRWTVETFSTLGDYLNGYAFKPSHLGSDGIPIVKIKELKGGVVKSTPRYHGNDIPAKFHLRSGDLLFSWSADLDAYIWPGGDALLNQHLFKVTPSAGVARSWLYLSLRERMQEFRARSQGTTMKHIKRSALGEVAAVRPPFTVMDRFDDLAAPLLGTQLSLVAATRTLESIRARLLPKLVTGQIDLSDLHLDGLLAEAVA